MIDARHRNPPGQRGMGEQHQRKAVRPARYREPKRASALISGPQRRQIGSEAPCLRRC
jgi:hypothetical protein